MRIAFVCLAAVAAALGPASALAQSARQVAPVELLPDYLVRKLAQDPYEAAVNKLVSAGRIEQGIIYRARLWPAGQPISVCFFGGSVQLRRNIVAVASRWERVGANVRFDFGDRDAPRLCDGHYAGIRVGYSERGYWSLVGQDSVAISQQQESLNLEGFDEAPPGDPEFDRLVLHEFGHALGFQHEHQNPTARCEEQFNFVAIYQYLRQQGWSKQMVDENMRGFAYHDGDIVEQFDPKSIMLYSFPVSFYTQGKQSPCYAPENTTLSEGDKHIVRVAYAEASNGGVAVQQSSSSAALERAAGVLAPAEQESVENRLALFNADNATKERIIGTVRPQFVDVDLFACDTSSDSALLASKVAQIMSEQPKIGRLRYRGGTYPGSAQLRPGVNIVTDIGHPEEADAHRLVTALNQSLGGGARVVPNSGTTSRWLLSIAACGSR